MNTGGEAEEADAVAPRGGGVPNGGQLAAAIEQLRPATPEECARVEEAAVAVIRYEENWTHAGILYRPELDDGTFGEPHILHLAEHYDLQTDGERVGWHFVEPDFPAERAVAIPALCDLVHERYGETGLSFAVKYRGEKFDLTTGEYLTDEGKGLTCATFVLALMESVGFRLVDIDDWPTDRPDDAVWHARIVRILKDRWPEDTEHHAAVEAQSPCARFRPQEVAAAATADEHPAVFAYAEPVGEQVRQRLPISE